MGNPSVTTTQTPWLVIVLGADPDFEREKHHELAYEFQSFGRDRHFYIDPYHAGAYAPDYLLLEGNGGAVLLQTGGGLQLETGRPKNVLADDSSPILTDDGKTIWAD